MNASQVPTGFAKSGFTLMELLISIGIIGILSSIVLVAVNPARMMAKARDSQRVQDIHMILNGVYQYMIDKSRLPVTVPVGSDNMQQICKDTDGICNNGINLRSITGTYLPRIPYDPRTTTATGTNYFLYKDISNRLVILSKGGEINTSIQLSR